MSDEVYQRIWSEDSERFTVSGKTDDGEWTDPNADILLDEQVKASGRREIDLATRPLFHRVNAEKLQSEQITRFVRLLDNYAVNNRDPEIESPAETREIDDFLETVLDTRPMRIAQEVIADSLVPGLAGAAFAEDVRRIWFEPYTNHFNGRSTHFCSGFEHVFVGEGKFKSRSGPADVRGEISGYHSWIKFHLDESLGRVDYLGYKYDLSGGQGPDNPHVVTLQMIWNHLDFGGQLRAQLFKKKGGFFVGPSPACEMALATLAYFESVAGMLNNQRKRVDLGGGTFDLVLFRSTLPDGKRGRHIRSFFPIYLGNTGGAGEGSSGGGDNEVVVRPVNPTTVNDGPVRIAAALPNPPGDDRGTEWVELTNVGTEPVVLDGWELRDRMSRPQPVSGSLAPNATVRVLVARATPNMMQMSNKRGIITLHDETSRLRAAVSYGSAVEGDVLTF